LAASVSNVLVLGLESLRDEVEDLGVEARSGRVVVFVLLVVACLSFRVSCVP